MINSTGPSVVHISASQLGALGVGECLKRGGFDARHICEGSEAGVAAIEDLMPDLAIIGTLHPEPAHRSFTLCREITDRWPNLPVILIHIDAEDDLVQADAMMVGATACLPVAGLSCDDLVVTCRSIIDGAYHEPNRDLYLSALGIDGLTPRQIEVLRLAAAGKSAAEIAAELDIAPNTVKAHERSLRQIFNVTSIAAVAERARRIGID